MAGRLAGKKIAMLVDNGFEQVELERPKEALEKEGATVELVSPQEGEVKGWQHTKWGDSFHVDTRLDQANAIDYDALVLPGGVMSPDHLRQRKEAVSFVRRFVDEHKPIAAICHGPWTLIEANAVKGRRMTSWPSLKTDLKNAGAQWLDEEVVLDDGLVTSRGPKDLDAFCTKMVEQFERGLGVS